MVSYVDTAVAVTVMCLPLFVLLKECDGARLTVMLVWGWIKCGECRACGWYTWFRYCI